MTKNRVKAPIGIFDSGVGGLSVLVEIQKELAHENLYYFADQAHVPYGLRGKNEVLAFSQEIARFLINKGSKLLVVACNTASAAALQALRKENKDLQIVGMEPAVKPAAEHSETGVVGVLATPSTFEGDLYASVVGRFGQDATILKSTCSGLVEEIEAGRAGGEEAQRILKDALEPMMKMGLDSVVLGCTHYPFAIDLIRDIVGQEVRIFDPAPAIANRVKTLLAEDDLLHQSDRKGELTVYSSSQTKNARKIMGEMLSGGIENFNRVRWQDGTLQD